jgi:hypothetical protein
MSPGIFIWHAPHSSGVVREDAHKEGQHLPQQTYTGPMCMLLTILLIFLSYACDEVYIEFFFFFFIFYVDNVQERMTHNLSSDPAATQSV